MAPLRCKVLKGNEMSRTVAGRGFFRNAMNTLIAAREREAARRVAGVLLTFDDARLAEYGYVRADLQKERASYY